MQKPYIITPLYNYVFVLIVLKAWLISQTKFAFFEYKHGLRMNTHTLFIGVNKHEQFIHMSEVSSDSLNDLIHCNTKQHD